ncbi:MAG: hypothetical protein CMJ28_04170 [Phycisphaerae bacterium]|nr:hypothetical protein [Phycisphaerae bacterium]
MNRTGLFAALVLGAMVHALLAPTLTVNLSWCTVQPRLVVLPLVAMILYSPRGVALGSAAAIGVYIDLQELIPQGLGRLGPMLGPWACGGLVAATLLVGLRGTLVRKHPVVVGLIALVWIVVAGTTATALRLIHDFYESSSGLDWTRTEATNLLVSLLAEGIWTGLLAAALTPLMSSFARLAGVPTGPSRRLGPL